MVKRKTRRRLRRRGGGRKRRKRRTKRRKRRTGGIKRRTRRRMTGQRAGARPPAGPLPARWRVWRLGPRAGDAGALPAAGPLPAGWREVEVRGQVKYVNNYTNSEQNWRPIEPAKTQEEEKKEEEAWQKEGWERYMHKPTGLRYWYNYHTGVSQWTKPVILSVTGIVHQELS